MNFPPRPPTSKALTDTPTMPRATTQKFGSAHQPAAGSSKASSSSSGPGGGNNPLFNTEKVRSMIPPCPSEEEEAAWQEAGRLTPCLLLHSSSPVHSSDSTFSRYVAWTPKTIELRIFNLLDLFPRTLPSPSRKHVAFVRRRTARVDAPSPCSF